MPPKGLDPCHKRFSWLEGTAKHEAAAEFAAKVVDISRGTRVIATILRQHLIDLNAIADGAGASVEPLLNENDTLDLAALMEVSLDTLCEMADAEVGHFNDQAQNGARA
jgi:hypothetical protein